MSNYEREASIRPPIFDGTNFVYWKVRVTAYLQSLGTEVWDIIDTGYTFPSTTPTDPAEKKKYEQMKRRSILYKDVYLNQNLSR